MFKSMKWKMMIPILISGVFIIGGFAAFIFKTTNDSIQQQGAALVESIRLGIEGVCYQEKFLNKLWKMRWCLNQC